MTNNSDQSAMDGIQFQSSASAPIQSPIRPMCRPQLTNPKAKLPLHSLHEIPNILTDDEAAKLVKAIDKQYYRDWCPEGYDRRHRVQRYSPFDDDTRSIVAGNGFGNVDCVDIDEDEEDGRVSMEEAFGWIFDRIILHLQPEKNKQGNDGSLSSMMLHRPFEVVVIEHTPSSCQSVVKTFEEKSFCPCRLQRKHSNRKQSSCKCYIAQLTLMNNAIQSIEKPLNRELECWDLAQPTEHHETNLVMKQNGVIVKRGEVLWDWRSGISNVQEKDDGEGGTNVGVLCNEMDNLNMDKNKKKEWTRIQKLKASNKRCIIVAFRGIRQPEVTEPSNEIKMSIPKAVTPSLPLSKLLTIIVTTSPIRSNPSTEMLEETFGTFPFAGDEFAYECPKVIVCDGCRVLDGDNNNDCEEKKDETNTPKITRKYANTKQTLRNGIATTDQAKNYKEFKLQVQIICEEANASSETKSPFVNTQVVELEERHGYGFALRHALCHCVDTPYVCVIQHDRTFMRPTPVKEVVAAMEHDAEQKIKYVGMTMRSNLMYHDIFSGRFGRRAVDEFKPMALRPKELCISGNAYGFNGKSVENMLLPRTEKRRRIIEALKETYRGSHQYITYNDWLKSQEEKQNEDGFQQLTLTPTLFWYDNTHIVNTAHYRDFIFCPQYKMVARGGFVEDKLSPCILRSCERLGLKDGHAKFGCYLLDDHSGAVFTGHIDGGSYRTANVHCKNDKYAAKVVATGSTNKRT